MTARRNRPVLRRELNDHAYLMPTLARLTAEARRSRGTRQSTAGGRGGVADRSRRSSA